MWEYQNLKFCSNVDLEMSTIEMQNFFFSLEQYKLKLKTFSEPNQASKTGLSTKTVNGFKPFASVLDVWQVSGNAYATDAITWLKYYKTTTFMDNFTIL